jgi:3-hydroxybutyryl-CoA dehydrogenase
VARPFYGEALRLLGEGVANHETIDRIVEQGAGFKMGPFRLMDLIGIDINAGAMRSMYEQTFGEPRYKPHWLQMQKLAEGALGKKTGRGFYEYKDGGGVMRDGETNAEGRSQQAEDRKEQSTIAQPGHVLISDGTWAPGLAELFKGAGYELDSEAEPGEIPAAGFVVAGRSEDAERLLASYDQSLRPDVPLFVQCADIAFSEAARWVEHSSRMIGFDGLFLSGAVVTLIASGSLSSEIKASCEAIFHHVGKHIVWVNESPAMVLPRIVCQLVNEAAFAELEAVGDRATIDLAMKLGVSYPLGPLEWGEAIGYGKVLAVLDHLVDEYHEERYRACVSLRRLARQ